MDGTPDDDETYYPWPEDFAGNEPSDEDRANSLKDRTEGDSPEDASNRNQAKDAEDESEEPASQPSVVADRSCTFKCLGSMTDVATQTIDPALTTSVTTSLQKTFVRVP
jgi:hypothetical protein